MRCGTSVASQGERPKHNAWAIPKWPLLACQSGLKWSVKQIFPPRYILIVLPSSSGIAISGDAKGYDEGI